MKPSLNTTTTRALPAPYANGILTLAVSSVRCLTGPSDPGQSAPPCHAVNRRNRNVEFRKLTVLGFHKIGEPSEGIWHTWNYISVDQFAAYMNFLADDGFRVIDHRTFINGLSSPQLFGPRDALLTFDDGYRSTLTEALPVLK